MSYAFEPGCYRVRVVRWALVKAKTGTPQFAVTFLPLGKLNMANAESELSPCVELERTIYRAITDKTAPWFFQELEHWFGYTDKRFSPLDPENAEAFDFANKEFNAVLSYEDRVKPETGEIKSGVERWQFASTGAVGEPLSTQEARQLDTLYGSAKPKKNGRKRAAAESTPATNETPAPEAGRDVPV